MNSGDESSMTAEDLARADERQRAQTAPTSDEPAVPVPQTGAEVPRPDDGPNSRSATGSPESGDAEGGPGRPDAVAEGGTPALAGQQRQAESSAGSRTPPADTETHLISLDAATGFRARWTDIQAAFVDEPRQTLEHADGLVAEVIQLLTRTFADERSKLEAQWTSGAQVSTEDMRLAFQRYRTFFNALLR
jgi:hypothetical protein